MQNKIKIVIADDNPVIRKTLEDVLTEKEYQVETVKDGYELLDYLKTNSPHIIILDLMMPLKDGLEILSAVKNISPYTRIIIYTGFQKYKDSPFARIADKFLLKNEGMEKLLQTLEEIK